MFFLSCWRRLRRWEEQDIWLKAWRTLLGHPDEQGQLDRAEIFADGSFAPAEKKGACVVFYCKECAPKIKLVLVCIYFYFFGFLVVIDNPK